MVFEHNLGVHWKNVRGLLNSIKCESASELRQWMISYVNGELFYTVSDVAKWNDDSVDTKDLSTVSREYLGMKRQATMNVSCSTLTIEGGAQIGVVVEKVNQ